MTVTKDATGGYIPQSAAEMTSLMVGLPVSTVDLIWMLSQASGNSTDQVGSIPGVPSGDFAGPQFHQALAGWVTLGIKFTAAQRQVLRSTAAGLPDLSTDSMLIFVWTDIPNLSAGRGLMSIGAQGQSPTDSVHASLNSNGSNHTFELSSNGHSVGTSTDEDGAVHIVALQLNRDTLNAGASQLMSLTTETDQESSVIDTTATGPNGKSLTIGSGDFAAGADLAAGNVAVYVAAWFATKAELSLATISAMCQRFVNGPPSILTSAGSSAGTSTAAATGASISPTGVVLSPAEGDVVVGDTIALDAIETFGDSSTVDVTATATWATNNPLIATVTQGVVRGISRGEVTISATFAGFTGKSVLVVKNPVLGLDYEKLFLPRLTLAERRPGG